jgi:lipopolysaccharide/colanic/teichoic acid biosynthesis glycosyltransferase
MPDLAHEAIAGDELSDGSTPGSEASVPAGRNHPVQYALKRVADLCIALVGTVLISPLLILIAVLIKLDSPGPVLFVQQRIGKDGCPFTFLKYRTMEYGNDPEIHRDYVSALIREETSELKGEGGSYKIEADPRVTQLGHILRRTSLDELPQLFNVLMGDMSLVGPRPPIDYEVELYGARERGRLAVLPGMTGLWQVSGRCETTYQEMVDLDLEYIRTWSLLLDLKILFRTVGVVFDRKGAW